MSDCTFCDLIQKKVNKLYEDDKLFVMMSPEPAAPGHVVVLPKAHAPILEAVPDFVVGEMFKVANKVGVAVFEGLGAQGTNILVQNGSPAGQKHNHVMLHVLPRGEGDNLPLTWNPQSVAEDVLTNVEGQIKDETKNIGLFEKEKEKPIEMDAPEEVKESAEEDYRIKNLKRIP